MESLYPNLSPEFVYSPSEMLRYLQMGEQLLMHYVFKGLFPLVRIIETLYDPDQAQLVVSDTREVVILNEGSVITYTITDRHYPDQDCDLGTGVWSSKPSPTILEDLTEVGRTGFLITDYSLKQIAIELNQ